ncbi:MAG TPA: hypothetical protein VFU35_13190, partial [Jatrophihabitans sp.]|nr:hypothetical protein [Jatrophihabitans sp.]
MNAVLDIHRQSDIDDVDGLPVSVRSAGDPLPGDVLAWERFGVGHRCETWLGWSRPLWSPVVVKLPRPHQTAHPRARRTLHREVTALAGNLHPGLPRLLADGSGAEEPYVVLEYVDGATLAAEVDDNGAFTPDDV